MMPLSPSILTSWDILYPMLSLFVPAMVLLLLASTQHRQQAAKVVAEDELAVSQDNWHFILIAVLGVLASVFFLWQQEGQATLLKGALLRDPLSRGFGLVALFAVFIVVWYVRAYHWSSSFLEGEVLALLLLSTVGILLLVNASELWTLFMGVELMSLSAYVLVGFDRASKRSQEAAMKYFIYGAFVSAWLLFGMALVYGEVGRIQGTPSLSYEALSHLSKVDVRAYPLGLVGFLLILSAMAFKISAVPFHTWAADAYDGAPTPIGAFLASAMKVGALAAFYRLLVIMMTHSDATGFWQGFLLQLLLILALLSLVIGNIAAFRQKRLKRFLAYSGIAHMGYLLMGILAALYQAQHAKITLLHETEQAILLYLVMYCAMSLGAFGVIIALEQEDQQRLDLDDTRLVSLAWRRSGLAVFWSFFLLSLAGIPPLGGFWGKFALIAQSLFAGQLEVVLVALACSLLSLSYYFSWMAKVWLLPTSKQRTYFNQLNNLNHQPLPSAAFRAEHSALWLALSLCLFLLLAWSFLPLSALIGR